MAAPPQLKAIQHYLRNAQEHETREPVVAYYCKFVKTPLCCVSWSTNLADRFTE